MFHHIKKDITERTRTLGVSEKRQEKKTTAAVHELIGTLIGSDAIEGVSVQKDVVVVRCSSAAAASRARMHTQAIQEKAKARRVYFLS
jgi:predicted nucleic acid-binding Zn ribbon protein